MKRVFTYLHYFLYTAFYWNIGIAAYILYYDIKGEKKYHIHTSGVNELKHLKKEGIDTSATTIYTAASYPLLDYTFQHLPPSSRNHFIDIGCGMGRTMCVAAHYGFKKVSGIDFSKKFCDIAKDNLAITHQMEPSFDFNVINKNALNFEIPSDADCLFFFNPFNETVMKKVINNVMKSLKKKPHDLYIAYVNPLYKDLWIKAGFSEIYHTQKLRYIEESIFYYHVEMHS